MVDGRMPVCMIYKVTLKQKVSTRTRIDCFLPLWTADGPSERILGWGVCLLENQHTHQKYTNSFVCRVKIPAIWVSITNERLCESLSVVYALYLYWIIAMNSDPSSAISETHETLKHDHCRPSQARSSKLLCYRTTHICDIPVLYMSCI
jgi:hypothetical protein